MWTEEKLTARIDDILRRGGKDKAKAAYLAKYENYRGHKGDASSKAIAGAEAWKEAYVLWQVLDRPTDEFYELRDRYHKEALAREGVE